MIRHYSPVIQTLLGTGLTWAVTALGAAFCAFQSSKAGKHGQGLILDFSLGFSAGVMLSASFWSLLHPAIMIGKEEMHLGSFCIVPATVGIILGAGFMFVAEYFLPAKWLEPVPNPTMDMEEKLIMCSSTSSVSDLPATEFNPCAPGLRMRKALGSSSAMLNLSPYDQDKIEKPSTTTYVMTHRLWLLIIAITVHNIPEGLAVGIAFGGIGQYNKYTFTDARNLAIGIAIQNFPEGLSVSVPLRASGYSFWKSFWFGQLSGLVEPIAGLAGCLAVQVFRRLQPYALGFAAGAMLFVVFDDVIPEAQTRQNGRLASVAALLGFIVMMCLDVAVG